MFNHKDAMFPILCLMRDGKVRKRQDIVDAVAKKLNLSKDELNLKTNRGELLYKYRIQWGVSYLSYNNFITDANRLLERVERATYRITELGKDVAKSEESLAQWYEKTYKSDFEKEKSSAPEQNETPSELVERYFDELNGNLKAELMAEILKQEPRFFENLILKLLGRMGYGVKDGELTINGPDGGIDGIIDEDVLGFSKIYVQAKRYKQETKISRDQIQQFVGALNTKPTQKGIFVTTSDFTKHAIAEAQSNKNCSLVLINGDKLCDLMITHKIGVRVKEIKEICDIDLDFFEE